MANAEVQERIQNQNLEEMVKASGAEDTDSTKPAQEEVPAETAESRALAQADQKASQDIVQKTAELQAAAENAQNALFENIDGATIASAAAFEEEQALYEENAEESEVYDHEVIIRGEVFATSERETKSGRIIFSVSLTDYTDSIRFKLWIDPEEVAAYEGAFKNGAAFLVRGMPALNSIEGLGDTQAVAVEEAAKAGPFLSKDDFRVRTKVSKTIIDALTELDILSDVPESNQISLFDLNT